jgi:hypothetical protein
LDPLFELFFILGGPRVPREKLQKLRLNEIGGVFGGTQNIIISWIVKPLSILVG